MIEFKDGDVVQVVSSNCPALGHNAVQWLSRIGKVEVTVSSGVPERFSDTAIVYFEEEDIFVALSFIDLELVEGESL